MKLRKCLALFLAAALIAPVLSQRGSAASASEIVEDAGEGEVVAEAENSNLELGGNAGNVNESETTDKSQMVDESATADKSEKLDGQETPDESKKSDEQDMPDEPDGDDHKDLEEAKAPEKSETGETTEAAEPKEPGQTDPETSVDDAMTGTDEPLDHTVSKEIEETNKETEDSEKADNTESIGIQENSVPKTAESEMSNEVLAVNPEDGLETQEGDIASGVDGDITWRIDADGKLTVNGTGDFSTGSLWLQYWEQIISAEVNITGMTNVSDLFGGLSNLQYIDLSNFDTGSVTDMSYMFYECDNLKGLDLSNFDTSNVTDMSYMFYGCRDMKELDLSDFDTSNVTNMREMFSCCTSLESLNVDSVSTGNVISMKDMFYECSSLRSLDLGNFDTHNVTDMEGMFKNCSNLESLNVNSFNTSNVIDMAGMFMNCASLKSLDLSSFNTENVTSMSNIYGHGMFRSCSSLTNLDLSKINTGKVNFMRDMFYECSSLRSLDLGNFDTGNVTDMSEMFWDCINLESLNVSSFNTSNVINMAGMFRGCMSLKSLDLSSFNTENVTTMCDRYENGMFKGCSSLSSLDLSGFDTMNVTDMSGMFQDCSSLSSLDLSNFDTTNVTNMCRMFQDCSSLSSLDLSSLDTTNVTIMWDMFRDCSSLSSLDLSSFDTKNMISMTGMFDGCTGMTEIHTPFNVKESISLPLGTDVIWLLPDGTEITELPQNLDHSVMITRRRNPKIITTTPDLNMDDVIRVKYVPYSYTVETNNWDEDNKVTFSIEKGELAEGLQLYPETGEIYGVPLETGEFPITVKASYSNPEYLPSYADLTLTVIDNTDNNVLNASDAGYEVEQHIGSQMYDSADTFSYVVTESADQLFISAGAYSEFMDFWLNGRKLVEGEDYTKESGSTRITIRKQTFEEKADQNGTNTIAAEFRVGGKPENALKRTAQNFRMDLQSENNNEEHHSGSGSRGRGGDSGGSSSGSGTAGGSYATSVIRLVDASGNPLPDTILELHSTPQEARTDQNGIAVFAEVENGVHTLYAKNGNGTIFALKSFELLFGENTGIMNDQITVKAGTAFTLNVQVDGNELKFLNLQEGDLYQVVSAATSDNTRPAIWFLLAVLSAGTISGGILYRRRKQYAGSMQ